MMFPILLDVAPDPPSAASGVGVLIALLLVILFISALLVGGLVMLLIWRKRSKMKATAEVVQEATAN
jgi:hypothetical protein